MTRKFLKASVFQQFPHNQSKNSSSIALNLHNKIFKFCSRMILEWYEKTERFTSQGVASSSYRVWYFNIFIVIFLIAFWSCVYVVANWRTISTAQVFASVFFGTVSIFVWLNVAVIIQNWSDLVQGLQCLASLKNCLGNQALL